MCPQASHNLSRPSHPFHRIVDRNVGRHAREVNAHEVTVRQMPSSPKIDAKDVPKGVKAQDCTLDVEEGNVTGGTGAAMEVVLGTHHRAFHDVPYPIRGDARLPDHDDPSPYQAHLSDWFHAHMRQESVGTKQHLVARVRRVAYSGEVEKETGRGLEETQKEMESEEDELNILNDACEVYQGPDAVQVGGAVGCDGLTAHDWVHRGLGRDNDRPLSLEPKVFEVANGGFHRE